METIINEILKPIISRITEYAHNKDEENKYKKNLAEILKANYTSHRYIKNLLHIHKPVLFSDYYYPLSIFQLTSNSEVYTNNPIIVEHTRSLMETVNKITILGNAGSGKSTLLNHLFLDAIESNYKFPVMIFLRYLNDSSLTLYEILLKNTIGFMDFENSNNIFVKLLMEGSFIFFFDGFDEITPNKQYPILYQIKELSDLYPQNKYVVSSREIGCLYTLGTFHNYKIAPLSIQDRNNFILKQYPQQEDYAYKVIKKIESAYNSQYYKILNSPLVIILCLITLEYNSQLPEKRSDFYKRIFNALYQEHDYRSKQKFERQKKCQLDESNFCSILNKFSFMTHMKSIYPFTQEKIYEYLDIIKKNESPASPILKYQNCDILHDLSVSINILTIDGNYYAFPHKSFHEFYAANHIVSLNDQLRKEIYTRLTNNFLNPTKTVPFTIPFLQMLFEMDNVFYINYFALPILKELQDSIEKQSYLDINLVDNSVMLFKAVLNQYDFGAIRLFSLGNPKGFKDDINELIIAYQKELSNIDNDDLYLQWI